MLIDDHMLRKAFGAGGTDIVGVQHFQHVGAGVTHGRADGNNDQRDDGQHQMVGAVTELAPRAELGIITPDQAVQVKPAKLDREQQLEQRGKEETGQRDAHQSHSGDDVIGTGILFGSSQDAQGHSDDHGQHKGDTAHDNRQTNNFLEFLNNRDVPLPAVTELTVHCAGQPGHETGQDALIQTIGCVELIQPFLIRFCARCLGQLHGHVLGKRAGQAAHHHIDDEGNAKQDHKRKQDTLDDVVSHLKNRSFLRGQGGRVFNGCAAWLQNTHEPGPCSFAYGVPKKSKI